MCARPTYKEMGERSRSNLRAAYMLYREGYYLESTQLAHDAAEKALKAFMSKNQIDYELHRNDHRITELLNCAKAQRPELAEFDEGARRIDINYMPSRYPGGAGTRITAELSRADYEFANKLCTPLYKNIQLDEIER